MKSIKVHTHQEREKVIQKLIPIIKRELGSNLIALAVSGSVARNKDINFSDLELVVIIRKPLISAWEIRKIEDGLLIVVVAETKEDYIKKYLEISDIWYASGADILLPIINAKLIQELNNFEPKDIEKKCLQQIQNRWCNFQEINAKTLNMIVENNKDGFPIIFHQMIKELVIILSYLNQIPFVTLGSYITQAKQFKTKPKGFEKLMNITINGEYKDLSIIYKIIEEVITDLELLFNNKGIKY